MKPIHACHLYGILDLGYVGTDEAARVLEQMLLGGVDIVQLRAKKAAPAEVAALACRLHPLTREAGVPFVINDHPALVAETGVEAAHVGQDDLSVSEARRLAGGAGKWIGKSTHSLAQALAAAAPRDPADRPDYIGFGPLFATPTKPDYTPIGLEEIREVHARIDLPIFCIGGVKRENLKTVLAAGARRVVIVSGILQAADIAGYCRDVKAQLAASSF